MYGTLKNMSPMLKDQVSTFLNGLKETTGGYKILSCGWDTTEDRALFLQEVAQLRMEVLLLWQDRDMVWNNLFRHTGYRYDTLTNLFRSMGKVLMSMLNTLDQMYRAVRHEQV